MYPVHTAVETRELVRRAVRSAEVGICLEAARAVSEGGALGASRRTQMTPCARDASALDGKSAGVSHVDADVSEDASGCSAKKCGMQSPAFDDLRISSSPQPKVADSGSVAAAAAAGRISAAEGAG